ncbi:MAG: hypothetical protein ABJ004_13490 [Cyclobacteriaceae bacterium]
MKKFFRFVGYAVLVYVLLGFLVNLLKLAGGGRSSQDQTTYLDGRDRLHERCWVTPSSRLSFCASYESEDRVSRMLAAERGKIAGRGSAYNQFWGSLYRQLVDQNSAYIAYVSDSLRQVSIQSGLSNNDFAELVVSFVQDIPYSFVIGQECTARETSSHPCVGNIRFGILSPYEFLHTLHGDCDTRAVLLFAMFEYLGYKPMIVISNEYAHAMLALNIPSSGKFLTHRRDKYYFWETTATGWSVGMLPPDYNNVNYWKIALVNEL